jgi:hypothetical protein
MCSFMHVVIVIIAFSPMPECGQDFALISSNADSTSPGLDVHDSVALKFGKECCSCCLVYCIVGNFHKTYHSVRKDTLA